jgi:hypothetical protein
VAELKKVYLLRAQYIGGFAEYFPLKNSWHRDIKLVAKTTLEELNSIVLTVLDWDDDDHLFAFTVGDRVYGWLGSDSFVVDDRMFKGAFYSAAIPLSALGLQEGDTFTHVFDFGDEHTVLFKVLRVDRLLVTTDLPLLLPSRAVHHHLSTQPPPNLALCEGFGEV